MNDFIDRLRHMSQDDALSIGDAWNALDEAADRLEELKNQLKWLMGYQVMNNLRNDSISKSELKQLSNSINSLEYEKKAKEILRKLESTKGSWQTTVPLEPGFYWVKQYQHKRIVHLWFCGTNPQLYASENGVSRPLDAPMYEDALWWSEPIVEPE